MNAPTLFVLAMALMSAVFCGIIHASARGGVFLLWLIPLINLALVLKMWRADVLRAKETHPRRR